MRTLSLILIFISFSNFSAVARGSCLDQTLSIVSGRSLFDTFATELSKVTHDRALAEDVIIEVLNKTYVKAVQNDFYSSPTYRAYVNHHSEKIQKGIERLRNLGFKEPKEHVYVPVKKFSDLTLFDRRWQNQLIAPWIWPDKCDEIAIALNKRGIKITTSEVGNITQRSLRLEENALHKVYADLASTEFSDSHWKSATQNTLKVEELHHSSWQVSNVIPIYDGFMNQAPMFDVAALRNADQTIPHVKILAPDEKGALSVQLNDWGHKKEGKIARTVSYETTGDKPYLQFYTPLYRKNGGLLPFDLHGEKIPNTLEKRMHDLFPTYDHHIQFRCAPHATNKNSLLCIGTLKAHYQADAPEYITAFHNKNVFMMTLKKAP